MSTAAIDTNRTNERLSAFLSEIIKNEPVDNYFPKIPALDLLMKNKKMIKGGRQTYHPIDSGFNTTIKDFSDYDVFDVSSQDTARGIVYPLVNKGGTVAISLEELKENEGDDHKIYDLVKHRRDNATKTLMDKLCADLFAATQASGKITSLNVGIDSTGTVGNLSQADDSDWAAIEIPSGSFATQGRKDMTTLYNRLVEDGCEPDTILTSRDIYEFYETMADPDLRYVVSKGQAADKASRGFVGLEFKLIPLVFDKKATSGVLYMWDSNHVYMVCDSEWNPLMKPFMEAYNAPVVASKLLWRGQLVIERRKSTGKLTGVIA